MLGFHLQNSERLDLTPRTIHDLGLPTKVVDKASDKTNYVYLILRNEQGDAKIVNSVNKRVTSLFPNKYSDIDIISIYVDSTNGKRKFFFTDIMNKCSVALMKVLFYLPRPVINSVRR